MSTFIKMKFARLLRKESTLPEKIVWDKLRNRGFLGLKFRRQHVIRGFVVDFYCPDLKLAVEIDGKIHEHQKEYDTLRQDLIERDGFFFIRITTAELVDSLDPLLTQIQGFISKKTAE